MTTNDDLLKRLNALSDKVEDLTDGNDLELNYQSDSKQHSQMLEVSPIQSDSYGDSIELMTKTRLKDYAESFLIAFNFVQREYHNMVGNRYGKHSKLIPVYDNQGKKTKIDMSWFSGSDIKIVELEDKKGNKKEYYKIRLLVYDILVKKLLLSRIPTADGKARGEEIQHKGAGVNGNVQNSIPVTPMQPIKYAPNNGNTSNTINKTGDILYDN